ncbi:hypothetical protein GCM10020221_00390 [Streptomyces thioluteus]|uniref:Major facilitator superfamily (MFS) profile domain-containing protein n=1 Tax=Streptomyces thioluteus TaxID=66431 RepID=A0ABN3W9N0_STRTU
MSLLTVVPAALGAVLLVLFVRRQRRRAHPLVDLTLFARPAFGVSVGCIVLAMLALVGLELVAAQYLQLVLGLSPLQTGLRLLPLTLAAMAAGLAGSRVLARFGPRTMVCSGFALTALAVVSLTVMGRDDRPVTLVCCFVLLGLGLETTLFGGVRIDAQRGARAGGRRGGGDWRDVLPAGGGHRHRAAGQRHERRLRARRHRHARRAERGVGRGESLAGRGVRGGRSGSGARRGRRCGRRRGMRLCTVCM